MRSRVSVGLFLALIGLASILISAIPVTRVDEVIDTPFALGPGSEYGPYDSGTYYHTRVFIYKSVLKGEVLVEGEGIYLTVSGHNTQHLRNIYVGERFSFAIDLADDQYTFVFDNSKGNNESLVRFTLREFWTGPLWIGSPPLFMAGLIGLYLLLPIGLATFAITYLRPASRIL
ncbi:hypothetical protein MUP79_08290 [Candidatus Bathyarchaeota archaeon]|jgi:hypothetical protein|nr:hypothetical protein [Candidatus Bathyarchaeota archaeon]